MKIFTIFTISIILSFSISCNLPSNMKIKFVSLKREMTGFCSNPYYTVPHIFKFKIIDSKNKNYKKNTIITERHCLNPLDTTFINYYKNKINKIFIIDGNKETAIDLLYFIKDENEVKGE